MQFFTDVISLKNRTAIQITNQSNRLYLWFWHNHHRDTIRFSKQHLPKPPGVVDAPHWEVVFLFDRVSRQLSFFRAKRSMMHYIGRFEPSSCSPFIIYIFNFGITPGLYHLTDSVAARHRNHLLTMQSTNNNQIANGVANATNKWELKSPRIVLWMEKNYCMDSFLVSAREF